MVQGNSGWILGFTTTAFSVLLSVIHAEATATFTYASPEVGRCGLFTLASGWRTWCGPTGTLSSSGNGPTSRRLKITLAHSGHIPDHTLFLEFKASTIGRCSRRAARRSATLLGVHMGDADRDLRIVLVREQPARAVIILFGAISFFLVLVKEELVRRWVQSNIGQEQFRRRLLLVGTAEDTRPLRRS